MPSRDILSGESADVYFARAEEILAKEGMDPLVAMEVFCRRDAVLCGIDEVKVLLAHVLRDADPSETDRRGAVRRRSRRAQGSGAAHSRALSRLRPVRDRDPRDPGPVDRLGHGRARMSSTRPRRSRSISFGARHIHPDVTDNLDYAAIIGGCVGASTPAGARLAGLAPTGTMPHSLVLHLRRHGPRGRGLRPAHAAGRAAHHPRRHVPRRGRGGAARRRRARRSAVRHPPRHAVASAAASRPSWSAKCARGSTRQGFGHVRIIVSGGFNPERILFFKEAAAPVDSYAVGSYISGARPIDFTGDLKEIDGKPIAKRGRIPGLTASPRLQRVDLAAWSRVR